MKKWIKFAGLLLLTIPVVSRAERWGDFIYTICGDNVAITKYTGSGGAVTIPAAINGRPVTDIEHHAFYETNLTSIKIPNSVFSIGDLAFFGCSLLRSVTIPDSVGYIGYMAFYSCSALTNIVIPDSVARIEKLTFSYCSSLTSVTVGKNVTSIGDGAFTECTKLQGIYFKGNAPYLGSHVFAFSRNLTVYHLPRTAGWGSSFNGYPVLLWNPKIQTLAKDAQGDTNAQIYLDSISKNVAIPKEGGGLKTAQAIIYLVFILLTGGVVWMLYVYRDKDRTFGDKVLCAVNKCKRGVASVLFSNGENPADQKSMKCPSCGLTNPSNAMRCDCGYNFSGGAAISEIEPVINSVNHIHGVYPQQIATREACIGVCGICGKWIGMFSLRYNFGASGKFCFECMTCSICGDKATGETRGMNSFQPFCQRHFEKYENIMKRNASEWPDELINGRIGALTKKLNVSRQSLQKMQAVHMVSRELSTMVGSVKSQLQQQNINYSESVVTNLVNDVNKALENEIASLHAILNERNKEEPTGIPFAKAPSLVAEIEKLAALHRAGALSDEEFAIAKSKLLQ